MKSIVTLIISLLITLGLNAQSVKNTRVELKIKNERIFPLPDTVKTYISNNTHLRVRSLEYAQKNPDIKVEMRRWAPTKYNVWKGATKRVGGLINESDSHFSESSVLSIKDNEGNILYHRVYTTFDVQAGTAVPKELEPDLFLSNRLSNQTARCFSDNYETTQRFQFYYVNKSSNHNDVNHAYELALQAAEKYNNRETEESIKLFSQAIDSWQNILNEKDLNNKKARINRKVTEAIYRNMVQCLIITERLDEASELIKNSANEVSNIFAFTLGRYNYARKHFEINNYVRNNRENLTLHHLELPSDLKPVIHQDGRRFPDNTSDITNLLAGSWRFFLITEDRLPRSRDDFNVRNRMQNLLNDDELELLHINPDGTKIEQTGSIERNGKQRLDDSMPYWRVAKGPEGEYYLFFSYDTESLEDIRSNFNQLEHAVIHYIDREKLVLRRPNYNPDANADGYFLQLYRVGLFLD